MSNEYEVAVAPVAAALELIGVEYYLAGSVISSLFGVMRTTANVDVVAALRREHAGPFAQQLVNDYYADEDMMLDASKRSSMFNVIHLATMMKVDVYIAHSAFDRSALSRRQRDTIEVVNPLREFSIASAEDVVLHELRWFRDGGEISERQWGDILGVLRVQQNLDLIFMRQWAVDLGVQDLLERALKESES